MPHKISILVRADVGRDAIELLVTGCLTEDTRRILAAQIGKARELDPSTPILIDLTDVLHIDPEALESLRSTTDEGPGGLHHAELCFKLPESTRARPLGDAATDESPSTSENPSPEPPRPIADQSHD